MFGKGSLDQASPRRSIYLTVKRSNLIPILQLFDAPDSIQSIGHRDVTTVPPQSLALMNSPLVRQLAEKFAKEWGHVIVLKGALTVIAEPGGKLAVIPVANPALASAGSGDVLAGLIAGLWAQRMSPFESAFVGAWVHAQASLVLKGALTVIAEPGGKLAVIPVANPALASAGSGDVLAGLIAGLWAQGMSPFESAFVGAWVHAQASLYASDYFSSNRGILASDLLDYLPELLAK